jgi:hypothetical protein
MPSQLKNVKRIDPTINKHEDLAGHDRAREACLFWTRNRIFGADQRRKRSEQTTFGCAKNKPLPKERLVDI